MAKNKRSLAAAGLAAVLLILYFWLQAASTKPATELVISAAASLQDSLAVIAENYEQIHPSIKLTFNYGSSGTLQKQIEQGAPADVFLSAGSKQMAALADEKLIGPSEIILSNSLVVIVPNGSKLPLSALSQLTNDGFKKIAAGQPETVPAGQYAQETLDSAALWDTLQKKLVFAKDVRQVLAYVETGNADAGFVYKSDAAGSDKVKIAFEVPAASHQAIVYPAAAVNQTKHSKEAQAFLQYLKSSSAMEVFLSNGFTSPEISGDLHP